MFISRSIAAIAALFGAGTAPNKTNKILPASNAESPHIETWFNSDQGREYLQNKETTSHIAKRKWIELSQAEKQLVSNEFRETQRTRVSKIARKADLIQI